MCNDYGNHIPYSDYIAAFSQTRIPVKWPDAAPNLEPRDDIWPTDKAPVIRRREDGTNVFSELRWGFPPARTRITPCVNVKKCRLSVVSGSASRGAAVPAFDRNLAGYLHDPTMYGAGHAEREVDQPRELDERSRTSEPHGDQQG